jgi:gliding motility-associated protein GldC
MPQVLYQKLRMGPPGAGRCLVLKLPCFQERIGMSQTEFTIRISSDLYEAPEKIEWQNSEENSLEEAKAVTLAFWDAQGRGSMVVNLWNKQMQTLELKGFYLEIMKKLSESVKSATDDYVISNIIDNACFQIESLLQSEVEAMREQ